MISIIIPTLGLLNEKNLRYQISNNTEKVPFEIIFCVPKKYFSRLIRYKKYRHVKIVLSNYHNQVKQRLEGIKYAKYNLILQLDDDICLKEFFITQLFNSSRLLINKFCLSPIYRYSDTKKKIYNFPSDLKIFLYKFFFQIDLKKNYGKLSNFGLAFDFSPYTKNINNVEWLPGGCMLTSKSYYKIYDTSIFKNFEKSYFEDVFFSIKSSNKKYIDNRISVYLLKEDNNEDLFLNLKYFNKIFFLNKKKNFLKYIIYVIYRCIKKLIF